MNKQKQIAINKQDCESSSHSIPSILFGTLIILLLTWDNTLLCILWLLWGCISEAYYYKLCKTREHAVIRKRELEEKYKQHLNIK